MRLLIIDFNVLSPINIDYQPALDMIRKRYSTIAKSASSDVFSLIESIKERASKKDFEDFTAVMSKTLDSIESEQVTGFSLNPRVRDALMALEGLEASVACVTNLGKEAAQRFLKKNKIDTLVGNVIAREKVGEPSDIVSRLNRAKGEGVERENCVYFCNKLADLKLAKSSGFRTIVLPSKGERLDLLMLEKPAGMIMSLDEIPNFLSLEVARTSASKPKKMDSSMESDSSSSDENDVEADSVRTN